MPALAHSPTVTERFFQPLQQALAAASNLWHCPEFPDDVWMHMGVQRVLESSGSGRGFLQEHGLRFDNPPDYGTYFAAMRSGRRRDLAREICREMVARLEAKAGDRLASIPELSRYACFAADGHWHKAATHDPRHAGSKMAVGHFYALNLKTHTLRHLAAGEGWHEHDMSVLKRITPRGLRQEAPKGTRVLMIYDKAGIDFNYWNRCRRECALYFLSRAKENMVFEWVEDAPWDRSDARNHGVLQDCMVRTREGHRLRLISYRDPLSGNVYEFLTSEPDLPSGVIAELYRRRWEVEKVFDELKNKLGQKKAWGTTMEARQTQALMIAITHNLLLAYEQDLETRHNLQNTAEDERRNNRIKTARKTAKIQSPVSSLVLATRRATQLSVKFLRWLRHAIRDRLSEGAAVARLRTLYAVL